MSGRAHYEDLTTLLYMVPFVGAIGYAIVLWAENGASALLPTSVYLEVTRDPILFTVGTLAILLGVMIEVNSTDAAGRRAKLTSLGGTVQTMAIASLVIVLLSALYANGFTNIGGAASDFVVGRYGLVFPAVMVLFSYLLTANFRLGALADRRAMGLVAMLLVPLSVYEIGKRQVVAGMAIALVLIVLGMYLFLAPVKKEPSSKEE
ncbi:MAG: hypothetical protein JRN08_03140 [Nitrososphaerota archaeon]|nr:hypothetical protein [Nitrososphaerota archaeon]